MSYKSAGVARCLQWAANSSSRVPAIQQRTFSSSLKRQKPGGLPSFQKSSPELDDALAFIREHIIMPAYLSQAQKKLIYSARNKRMLEIEPIVANIAGEEFRLQYVDPLRRPNSRDAFFRALSLMVEKDDFNNLPQLLEGLHKAKSSILNDSKAVRKLLEALRHARKQDILLECLRRASDTGLTLRTREIAILVMQTVYYKALDSEWNVKDTKKALDWSEMLLDLMEDPKHSPTKITGSEDPRASPELIALPLALAAMRASKHLDGKDEGGKVDRYATRLLATWNNLSPQQPTKNTNQALSSKNHWLYNSIFTQHGTTAAQSILGASSDNAAKLKEKSSELEEATKSAYIEITNSAWGKQPRLGPLMYERLFMAESL